MPKHRAKSDVEKLTDAISTLKRVTGVPNSPILKDGATKDLSDHYTIHTTDNESAVILANLLSQTILTMTGHSEKFWRNPNRRAVGWHETIVKVKDGNEAYRLILDLPSRAYGRLAELLTEKSRSLTAPEKNGRSH